jgi:hypothetical protein
MILAVRVIVMMMKLMLIVLTMRLARRRRGLPLCIGKDGARERMFIERHGRRLLAAYFK